VGVLWNGSRGAEPDPATAELPLYAVWVPTDGTVAAEERTRTRAVTLAPSAVVTSQRDVAVREVRQWTEIGTVVQMALVFILFVAACGLTVAVAAGLIERRRPFAMLRASGMRVSELRRIVLLETAAPMAATTLAGFGLGLLTSYALGRGGGGSWVAPGAAFVGNLGLGLLAAVAVTTLALPLIDVTTRHDAVRFE
jgi:ABC-type antimicrobial peptide transport system permease subunit